MSGIGRATTLLSQTFRSSDQWSVAGGYLIKRFGKGTASAVPQVRFEYVLKGRAFGHALSVSKSIAASAAEETGSSKCTATEAPG